MNALKLILFQACALSCVGIFLASSVQAAKDNKKARAAFENACQKTMKKEASRAASAKPVCECISRNVSLKAQPGDFEILTAMYNGTHKDGDDEKAVEQTDILFEFEADVAEGCLKNHDYKIKP